MSNTEAWNIINRNEFFVKNAVRRSEAKTSDKLDVHDPVTRELLLECREPEIGVLTQAARLMGGGHDRGTSFDLVARHPESGQVVIRASRANATLSFGGRPIRVYNQDQELVGTLKKKELSLGNKFEFRGERGNGNFVLEVKSNLLGKTREWLVNGKLVGTLSQNVPPPNEGYYREGGFSYACSIAHEVPPNDVMRQILVAFAIAQHRVAV